MVSNASKLAASSPGRERARRSRAMIASASCTLSASAAGDPAGCRRLAAGSVCLPDHAALPLASPTLSAIWRR